MIYYKVIKDNEEQGFINLESFRFYHPERKRMFMTSEIQEAQYIIFNGEYYRVSWFGQEEPKEIKGKYPKVELILTSKEEYEKAKSDEK